MKRDMILETLTEAITCDWNNKKLLSIFELESEDYDGNEMKFLQCLANHVCIEY